MLVRLFFSGYSKLLAGISLAAVAVLLAGCNDQVAEKPAESRPVLVATVHYEAQSPERSFVGTIRPRIETDMGFRVPGKVAKRLVEVGQAVRGGPARAQPPAPCRRSACPCWGGWGRAAGRGPPAAGCRPGLRHAR